MVVDILLVFPFEAPVKDVRLVQPSQHCRWDVSVVEESKPDFCVIGLIQIVDSRLDDKGETDTHGNVGDDDDDVAAGPSEPHPILLRMRRLPRRRMQPDPVNSKVYLHSQPLPVVEIQQS